MNLSLRCYPFQEAFLCSLAQCLKKGWITKNEQQSTVQISKLHSELGGKRAGKRVAEARTLNKGRPSNVRVSRVNYNGMVASEWGLSGGEIWRCYTQEHSSAYQQLKNLRTVYSLHTQKGKKGQCASSSEAMGCCRKGNQREHWGPETCVGWNRETSQCAETGATWPAYVWHTTRQLQSGEWVVGNPADTVQW